VRLWTGVWGQSSEALLLRRDDVSYEKLWAMLLAPIGQLLWFECRGLP